VLGIIVIDKSFGFPLNVCKVFSPYFRSLICSDALLIMTWMLGIHI